MEKNIRSMILEYISPELYLELLKVTKTPELNNNTKGDYIKKLLIENGISYAGLGSGTNRLGLLIDGYVFKFALDSDGMIDNQREFKYSIQLQPYVIKSYECLPNGLIMVCEYVEVFSLQDFREHTGDMSEILSDLSNIYLIGDVGVISKNYINWGKRADGSICILDFAYVYDVTYKIFGCPCSDTSILKYDDKFNDLVCPNCGKQYKFIDIRRRITKQRQKEEIGDITKIGYLLSSKSARVEENPDFDFNITDNTDKKTKKELSIRQQYKQNRKKYKESEDDNEMSFDDKLKFMKYLDNLEKMEDSDYVKEKQNKKLR